MVIREAVITAIRTLNDKGIDKYIMTVEVPGWIHADIYCSKTLADLSRLGDHITITLGFGALDSEHTRKNAS